MNTVRILICATFALLIAALVHSYSTKGGGEKSLSDLKLELEKVRLENTIRDERAAGNSQQNPETPSINPVLTAPVSPPVDFVNPLTPVNPEVFSQPGSTDAALAENAKLKAENAKLKKKQALQESENNMLQVEAGVIQNELQIRNKPEEERAAMIAQALVMARVSDYDPESGIIVLDLKLPQNLVTGQILGIRRGSAGGIIGRIKLGNIASNEVGFADPIPESFFDGPVDVKIGDEIIVIP